MIVAIIQARMDSSRLPNKVMLPLEGKSVLWHVVDRVRNSRIVDSVVVATSDHNSNDAIRNFCKANGIECISGSEDDVLDRYYKVVNHYNLEDSDHVVRITADCPLIDPSIVDDVINYHLLSGSDYTSNTIEPTFPDGLDCEVVKVSALKQAWKEAKMKSEREHVTLYIYSHPELFEILNYAGKQNLSHMRWTLDESEDYQFIKQIYQELAKSRETFNMQDVLALLERSPDLSTINARFARNEGLAKSLRDDGLMH